MQRRHFLTMASALPFAAHLGRLQAAALQPATPRLLFAHADWSGYSVFEEAFTRGHAAGVLAAALAAR